MGVVVTAGGWLATIARAAWIATVGALCVAIYSVAAARRLFIRDSARRAEHRARWRGRLLRWSFARLGGTFVKIGQVMSSRQDLFPPALTDELRSLQDRVPPFRFRQVRRILERELGAPFERRFRELDEVAVAAGSVAQVHRAILQSGDEVAVKVLRPGIVAKVRRDARILLWLAHLSHALSERARVADVVGHVRSLITGILAQTDLRLERNNYERFRRNFEGTSGLRFPRVYKKYSTRHILTMEYIRGARIDEARTGHLPGAVSVIRSSFLAMCFDHGFVHADLHPGNLLVCPDGEVVMIDVGLVKRLPRKVLDQMVDFTRCIATGTPSDLVLHLRTHHRYLAGTDWDAVEADAASLVALLRERPMIELELGMIIGELFALARKHKIRPVPEMTLVLLGIVTNEGMAKRLDPGANVIAELASFLGAPTRRRLARGSAEIPLPSASSPSLPRENVSRRHTRRRRHSKHAHMANSRNRADREV